jgi:hypothetical protein
MKTKKFIRFTCTLFVLILLLLTSSILIPVTFAADDTSFIKGFEKGVSWDSVVPMKKATFVNYDDESYLDDYAYLAAIPTSVFNDGENLYSHPLLFYQDRASETSEPEEITLDARTGIDYFMEDWSSYCFDKLDKIITINVPKEKVNHWIARNYTEIEGETPFSISKNIALHDWGYSDNAVVAVIDEKIDKKKFSVSNSIESTIPAANVKKIPTFNVEQKNRLDPKFKTFEVGDEYKFIEAVAWWDGLLIGGTMVPTSDPDLQLYCKKDDEWMQTSIISNYQIMTGPAGYEPAQSYVYNSGIWQIGITDFPTKSVPEPRGINNVFEIQGNLFQALSPKVTYHVDITLYPGIEIELPDIPPFGCKSADFKLTWDSSDIKLGFTLIGPAGEAIVTSINESSTDSQEIHIDSLGECLPGESYSVSVFSTKGVSTPIDFQIEYTFKQETTKAESDSLTSASEGAILASIINAPLLYTSPSGLSSSTIEVIEKLGVKNVYLVDIGSQISQSAIEEIQDYVEIKTTFKETKKIYDKIREKTDSSDVIFTTIDPWSYWLFAERKAAGEKEGALFIGPAAYIAAHHGSPLIIIDNHPRLSSAVVYHNEFWRRFGDKRLRYRPSAAEMILTGRRIYDFLKDYDFDKQGLESIITVADQFEIGVSWDRIFPGKANPGRFCGSPVDTSYWIARSVFYPALIYENPAMQDKVTLTNGSKSVRLSSPDRTSLLEAIFGKETWIQLNFGIGKLIRKPAEEEYRYPVLCSFISYNHRFNERASNYYGAKYQCANGMTPGQDNTMDPIDQGSAEKYTGNAGSVFPDISSSEIVPFYLNKGGYGIAFSTSLDAVKNNLNQGVLMWIHSSHGTDKNGGATDFWDPIAGFNKQINKGSLMARYFAFNLNRPRLSDLMNLGLVRLRPYIMIVINILAKLMPDVIDDMLENIVFLLDIATSTTVKFTTPLALQDKNPWRAYEWYLGSTEEPDTMSSDLKGIIPFTNIELLGFPATGRSWATARKPIREFLNKIIFRNDPSKPFNVENLYDGVVGTSDYSTWGLDGANSIEIEEDLDNLHSAAFLTNICQTSNTYFHLMLIRHGSVCQVQDPWPTSWYSDVWLQSIPRDIALGYTVGEAYSRGISQVAPLYVSDSPSWWWDEFENVVYFGDPDLRLYVPGTVYSDLNHWEKPDSLKYNEDFSINGHTPFGASEYPHKKTQKPIPIEYLLLIIGIIIYLLIMIAIIIKRKNEDKKRGEK